MAKAIKPTNIHRLIFSNAVLKSLSLPLLNNEYPVNVLGLVEYLSNKRISCNLLQISIVMGHNKRSANRPRLYYLLLSFIEAGYLTGKTTGYHITELGRNQLFVINNALSSAKIKIRKADLLLP